MAKPRTPRTTTAPAAATAAPAATNPTAQAIAASAPLYALTGKQPRQGNTPQLGGVKSGLGKGWVAAAKPASNSRGAALAALAALGATFTQAQGLAALGALPKGTLGSGSPRSYWAAFVASGYLAAVQ